MRSKPYLLAGLFCLLWSLGAAMLAANLGYLSAIPAIAGVAIVRLLIPGSTLVGVSLDLLLGALLGTALLAGALLLPAELFALALLLVIVIAILISGRALKNGSMDEARSNKKTSDGEFSSYINMW